MTLYEALRAWLTHRREEVAPTSWDKEARLVGWLMESRYANRALTSLLGADVEDIRLELAGAPGSPRSPRSITRTINILLTVIDEYRSIDHDGSEGLWLDGVRSVPLTRAAAVGAFAMLNRGRTVAEVCEAYGATPRQMREALEQLRNDATREAAA